mgnify:CR=1 FL=1
MLTIRMKKRSFHIFLTASRLEVIISFVGRLILCFSGMSQIHNASTKIGIDVIRNTGSNPMVEYTNPERHVAPRLPTFLASQHRLCRVPLTGSCLTISTNIESHPTSAIHRNSEQIVSTATIDFLPMTSVGEYAKSTAHAKAATEMYERLKPKIGLSDMTAYIGLKTHGSAMIAQAYAFSAGWKWYLSTMVNCTAIEMNANVNPNTP